MSHVTHPFRSMSHVTHPFKSDLTSSNQTCILQIRHVFFWSDLFCSDQTYFVQIRKVFLQIRHVFFRWDLSHSDQTCFLLIRRVFFRSDMSSSDQTSNSRWDNPSRIIRPILHWTLSKTDVLFQNRCPIWKKTSSGKKAPNFRQKCTVSWENSTM